MRPTYEQVDEILSYNPTTGELRWKVSRGGKRAGSLAGTKNNYGYIFTRINKVAHMNSRLCFLLFHKKWPEFNIDHINGNPLDNRISNLRDVSQGENCRNCKLHKRSTSGETGVSFHKLAKKWQAYIFHNGKRKHLGLFERIEDAVAARAQKNKEFGFHSNHGRKK